MVTNLHAEFLSTAPKALSSSRGKHTIIHTKHFQIQLYLEQ